MLPLPLFFGCRVEHTELTKLLLWINYRLCMVIDRIVHQLKLLVYSGALLNFTVRNADPLSDLLGVRGNLFRLAQFDQAVHKYAVGVASFYLHVLLQQLQVRERLRHYPLRNRELRFLFY